MDRLDLASRGAWGSLILLIRSRKVLVMLSFYQCEYIQHVANVKRTLPTIGAAIILLSLPLDGLFQRIVSYPIASVPDPSNAIATISRVTLYDPSPQIIWKAGIPLLSQDIQIEDFLWPFWQGKGIMPGVEFECGTSKCTYEPFHTLAVEFQCQEMTDFLEFGCRNTSAEWQSTISYTNYNSTD